MLIDKNFNLERIVPDKFGHIPMSCSTCFVEASIKPALLLMQDQIKITLTASSVEQPSSSEAITETLSRITFRERKVIDQTST